ncbi:hypothetical protein [Methanorbis rubei]|uniref:Uncharacterized protein n=1 Tax=Methanorbis rubei TaxID=3028300 RepID=A0AAE4SBY2_9EURY|nr:hypothetical protein [Methanocorpusculaceae archaeon Cs1]
MTEKKYCKNIGELNRMPTEPRQKNNVQIGTSIPESAAIILMNRADESGISVSAKARELILSGLGVVE